MTTSCLAVFALIFSAVEPGAAECTGPKTTAELYERLMLQYGGEAQRLMRPGEVDGSQDSVEVQLQIASLKDVDSRNQRFVIHVNDRFLWRDRRLAYNGTEDGGCLDGSDFRVSFPSRVLQPRVWGPDIHYENLLDGEDVLADQMWVLPGGLVWRERSLLLEARCSMTFRTMPYDTQRCFLELSSLRYFSGEDVALNTFGPLAHEAIPLTVTNTLGVVWNKRTFNGNTLEFDISATNGSVYTFVDAAGWTFRNLRMHFDLKRKPGYYERYVLNPVYLLVLISWGSFFVQRNAVPARVGLCLICFLTLTSRAVFVQGQMPISDGSVLLLQVIYVSIYFVFYTIMEYILANYLLRVEERLHRALKALPASHPLHDYHHDAIGNAIEGSIHKIEDGIQKIAEVELSVGNSSRFRRSRGTATQEGSSRATADGTHDASSAPAAAADDDGSGRGESAAAQSEQLRRALEMHVGRVRFLLVTSNGRMHIHDQTLDVFSRFAFLPAYILAVVCCNLTMRT